MISLDWLIFVVKIKFWCYFGYFYVCFLIGVDGVDVVLVGLVMVVVDVGIGKVVGENVMIGNDMGNDVLIEVVVGVFCLCVVFELVEKEVGVEDIDVY